MAEDVAVPGGSAAPVLQTERQRLLEICAQLLDRGTDSLFVVQVARVLSHILCGDTRSIQSPVDIALAFRSKRLLSPGMAAMAHDADQRAAGDEVAFAACLYPRRIFHLFHQQEEPRRRACFLELYAAAPKTLQEIVGFLLDHGRPRRRAAIEADLWGLIGDLCAAELDPDEDADRRAGAALHLATNYAEAIERPAGGGEPARGMLPNWADDGKFVSFLRSRVPTPPSSFADFRLPNGEPSFDDIQTKVARDLELPPTSPLVVKAVDLERILWGRRPRNRIAPNQFELIVANYWEDQIQRLRHGFPHYAFGAHFVRWWQMCAINLRNMILRVPAGLPVDLPRPCPRKEPVAVRTEMVTPRRYVSLEELWRIRERWRLVRTTFTPLRAATADEIEVYRARIDRLFQYHLENDVMHVPPDRTLGKLYEQLELNPSTGSTLIKRIRERLQTCQRAWEERKGNHAIEALLKKGAPLLVHRDIASLVRPIRSRSTLLWPFTAHVFFHGALDQMNPDPWNFARYAAELTRWVGDNWYEAVTRGAQNMGRPETFLLAALRQFGPIPADWSAGSDLFQRLFSSDEFRSWAYGLMRQVVGKCGLSIYEQVLTVFQIGRGTRALGDATEWIPITWYLIFVEGMPFDPEAIIGRLVVDRQADKDAIWEIVEIMEQHCRNLGGRQ